jgi:shikimate 5-dehydrogenase
MEYHHCPLPEDNDKIMNDLKPYSLVMNSTGLGKDAPGSPITDLSVFPENGIAWDFNYRGNLVFIDQAKAQQDDRNLEIKDGWVYFIHGWTRVIAEVFHIDIPVSGPVFDELCGIAASVRS